MTTKTKRSKDAARTPAPGATKHAAPTERAKREARKAIADNIARIEAAESAAAGASPTAPAEQNGQPQHPKADEHKAREVQESAAVPGTAPTSAQATAAASAKPVSVGKGGS